MDFPGRIEFSGQRSAAPCQCGVLLGGGLRWGELGVWTVSTLWVTEWAVPVRYWAGSVCFSGSPVFPRLGVRFESTSGTVFSLVTGLWVSECAQTVHSNCSLMGPAGALSVCGCCLLLCLGSVVDGYLFMVARVANCMTGRWQGSVAAVAGLHSLMSRLFMATFPGKRVTVCVLLTGSAPAWGAGPGRSDLVRV